MVVTTTAATSKFLENIRVNFINSIISDIIISIFVKRSFKMVVLGPNICLRFFGFGNFLLLKLTHLIFLPKPFNLDTKSKSICIITATDGANG